MIERKVLITLRSEHRAQENTAALVKGVKASMAVNTDNFSISLLKIVI